MAGTQPLDPTRARRRAGTIGTVAVLLLGLLGVIGLGAAPSGAAVTCQVDGQLLADELASSAGEPTTSGDGAWVAFASAEDLTDDNTAGVRQIFLLERATGALEQITAAIDHGGFQFTGYPSVSNDGSLVAFQSDADLTGSNADLSSEIFLYRATTGQVSQITDTSAGDFEFAAQPVISGDGSRIAFYALGDPSAGSASISGYFVHTVGAGGVGSNVSQIADIATIDATRPSISDDGSRVAFQASDDLTGQNAQEVLQVFLHQVGGSTQQLSAGESRAPAISGDGSRVAYTSPTGIRLRVVSGGTTTVVTDPDETSFGLGLDASGTRLAFTASIDPVGQNADGSTEIFVHDVTSATTAQVTNTSGPGTTDATITSDGAGLVFSSEGGLLGDPGGRNLYAASCSEGGPPPAGFSDVSSGHPFFAEISWMSQQGISTGYEDGTYRPGVAVTRQAMSAFMYRLAGSPAFDPTGVTFTDVSASHPFYDEIEWMADTGISEGYLPGPTYRPGAVVTRQAMSAFMYRLAGSPLFDPTGVTFTDVSASHPFYDEIEWMADTGISEGYLPGPTYRPAVAVSRQAMSAFMQRLADGPGVGIGSTD